MRPRDGIEVGGVDEKHAGAHDVGKQLLAAVEADPSLEITVDIERLTVEAPAIGVTESFPMDPSTRERFLNGLDDIGITLHHADAISSFENQRPQWMPAVH